MKNVKKFLFLFGITVLLTACSDDDDSGTSADSQLAGTYNLTAYNIPVAVDFDQDGDVSSNLMNESDCYLDTQIVLNSDNTYTAAYNYLLIAGNVSCTEEEAVGNWSLIDNNTIRLVDTSVEPQQVLSYTVNENQILQTLENYPYPDRDGDGNPIYSEGTVMFIFTKVE